MLNKSHHFRRHAYATHLPTSVLCLLYTYLLLAISHENQWPAIIVAVVVVMAVNPVTSTVQNMHVLTRGALIRWFGQRKTNDSVLV
jgi:hypothetical protein